jgi:protein-S-isoprenylcysteine O-methyltransferase Ste14
MNEIFGFLAPFFIYIFIFILNALLPGRWLTGYINKPMSSEKLKYRLNGLWVLATVIITWGILCCNGIVAWDWLWRIRWYSLAGAVTFGLIFSFAVVVPFQKVRKSFLADFYLGKIENPRLWEGRIDAKMWLYLAGAVMLELNVLSFAAHHQMMFGESSSPGIFMAAAFLSFFVTEYLFFEEVHLYTYDFLAERVGFKLGWGDLAFYPFFYTIPLWATVTLPAPRTPVFILVISLMIFLCGWCLARGANMQKYTFKKNPEKTFLGIKPVSITDGNKRILISGFWGMSRHINYLGEILMATGIVLSVGYPMLPWPWLYPLYYVILLFPRQMADDKLCANKYGPLWDEYKKKVPYRIIPYVY